MTNQKNGMMRINHISTWLPTALPRPANSNHHNLYHDFTVNYLINTSSRTWNSQAIRTLVDVHDVKLIESIALNRIQLVDKDGWHFTNNGKYTVKFVYLVERVYTGKDKPLLVFGHSVDFLKAFC